MEYIFNISNLEDSNLIPQISKALLQRSEMLSRKKYPNLWRYTDKLKQNKELKEKEIKCQRIRTRLLGVINLALGIFLFIPGLMKPDELLVPLVVGGMAIGAGIGAFLRTSKNKKSPFDRSAKILFNQRSKIPQEQKSVIAFTDDGMTISVETKSKTNDEFVAYSEFENIICGKDIILIIYKEKCALLQKIELVQENINDFCEFLASKTNCYHLLEE